MKEFMIALRTDWQTTLPFLALYIATASMDIVAGLCVAFTRKRLASSISRPGIMRKVLMLGTVLLAALFDGLLPEVDVTVMGLHLHMTFGALASVWWLIYELLSLTESAAILGLPIPHRLRNALAVVQDILDKPDKTEQDAAAAPVPTEQADKV